MLPRLGGGMAMGMRPLAVAGPAEPAWSPLDLFAQGENGFYYPTRTDLMFKSNIGNTGNVAVLDDQIGLAIDARLLGGKTLPDFLAEQAELRGAGTPGLAGTATAASYNASTGAGSVSRGASSSDQSFVTWTGLTPGGHYVLSITNTGGGVLTVRSGSQISVVATNIASGDTATVLVTSHTSIGSLSLTSGGNNTTVTFVVTSLKALPGNHATQSALASRPKYKPDFPLRQYDALDDALNSTATCGASGNTLAAKVTIPSAASLMAIMGTQASGANFWMGSRDGVLTCSVGTVNSSGGKGTTDILGQTGVAILVEDGATVRLHWDGGIEYSAARTAAPNQSHPVYEGALNSAGTPSTFFGGGVWESLAIQRALTTDEIAKLTNYWS